MERKRLSRCLLTLCAVLGCSLFAGAQAGAKTITPYVHSGKSFDGSDSTVGHFEAPEHIAINNANGNVVVIDNTYNAFSQFDENGNAVPFSGLAGKSSIFAEPWGGGSAVEIDNSGGPTQGNIYLFRTAQGDGSYIEARVIGYTASGEALPPPNWPLCGYTCFKVENFFDAQGLGIGPDGTIWVSNIASLLAGNQKSHL